MTDNEIINALECCTNTDCDNCKQLHNGIDFDYECKSYIIKNALDLINHQKAEIERLKSMVEAAEDYLHPLPFKNEHDKEIERVRTKAIKEFAERLKDVFVTIDGTFECFEVEEHIDDLVKEMEKQNDC